jgi:hypothetical protein
VRAGGIGLNHAIRAMAICYEGSARWARPVSGTVTARHRLWSIAADTEERA